MEEGLGTGLEWSTWSVWRPSVTPASSKNFVFELEEVPSPFSMVLQLWLSSLAL